MAVPEAGHQFRPERQVENVLALVQLGTLAANAVAGARAQALRPDRRGYRISPEVYGRTPPAERIVRP
jgi:hypothetical protein